MFADSPVEDAVADYLGFDAYATALAELIDNPKTATPLTIAISAPWGAGKTSLAKLLQKRLEERAHERRTRAHAIIWFNAWRHDAAPQLGAAFAADVARQLGRGRPLFWRTVAPLPGVFLRPWSRWWRRVLGAAALLAAVGLVVVLVPQVRDVFGSDGAKHLHKVAKHLGQTRGSILLAAAAVVVIYGYVFRMSRAVLAYIGNPRAEAARGSMDEVARQLGSLAAQASGRWRRRGRRVVIFVDDLERCRPPRAVEVCEVASQLLAHPNVVIVILADMSVIAASADIKYAKLERTTQSGKEATGSYGRLYLQKLVQIQFDLPPAAVNELRIMLLADAEAKAAAKEEKAAETTISEPDAEVAPASSVVRLLEGPLAQGSEALLAAVIATVATTVWVTTRGLGSHVPLSDSQSVGLVAGVALGGARTVIVLVTGMLRWRARRAEFAIDEEIDRLVTEDHVNDPEELERRVLASKPARRRQGLAIQRLRRSLVDDSALKHEATAKILDYLPPLPRSAKRMANHLRLLLVIAYERRMLGGAPSLTAAHLGKWVVMNERWSDLARVLKAEPSQLTTLERNAAATGLHQNNLDVIGANEHATELLEQFLKEEPKLGAVLERLVYLLPAQEPQGTEGVGYAVDGATPS